MAPHPGGPGAAGPAGGSHCPGCGGAVGLRRLLGAGLRDAAVRCPGCGARLRYRGLPRRVRLALTGVGLAAVLAGVAAPVEFAPPRSLVPLASAGLFLGTLAGLRLLRAIYWKRRGVLELAAPGGGGGPDHPPAAQSRGFSQ